MKGLTLHCGAKAISRSDLATLPMPEAQGPRHVIRPFIDDVELITDYMGRQGVVIEDEAYGVLRSENGQPRRFFGLMQVRLDAFDGSDGYGLMIGLRGSYDQTLSRALAVGSRVFVCDNLAFAGEVEIKTKQTTFAHQRLPSMFEAAIAQIPQLASRQHQRFDTYRNVEISQQRGDAALVELVRRGAMVPSQLGRALQEWDAPSHEEHAENGRSLWRLHNAVTEAIKPTNPERAAVPVIWDRTRTLTSHLDELAIAA